jgi:hypothetical protein
MYKKTLLNTTHFAYFSLKGFFWEGGGEGGGDVGGGGWNFIFQVF